MRLRTVRFAMSVVCRAAAFRVRRERDLVHATSVIASAQTPADLVPSRVLPPEQPTILPQPSMDSHNLPDPLVPADVDLRDFGFMPLHVQRLRDSDLSALATGDEFKAAVLLWCYAWHQKPAGSLPVDDRLLAIHSGSGLKWRKVKSRALAGFVRCNDGRLYHPLIAEVALDAWERRGEFKEKAANKETRQQRWRAQLARLSGILRCAGVTPPERPTKAQLVALCLQHVPGFVDADVDACVSHADVYSETGETAMTGTGTGTGTGTEERNTEGLRPSVDDAASPVDRPGLALVENPKDPEIPDCPQQELVALYRKRLPHLRQPASWDGPRADAMRTRWRECAKPSSFGDGYATKAEGLAFWDRFFAFVAENPKLRDGITSRDNGQVRVWKPSLDWLVTRGNFLKVIEGAFSQ